MTSMTQPKEYYLTIERRLQQVEFELQELAAEIEEQSTSKARQVLADLRESFDAKRRELRKKLSEAQDVGGTASAELKGGVEAAWADLRLSVARARAALKREHAPTKPPAA